MRQISETFTSFTPMTIGDILNSSIQLYKGNFPKFIGIVLLVKGPYLLLGYMLTKLAEFLFTSGQDTSQTAAFTVSNIITLIIRLLDPILVGPILVAAMTVVISERFLNRDIEVIEAYKRILKRFIPLLGTILLTGLIISTVLLVCVFLGFSMLLAGGQPGVIIVMLGGILACVLWVWFAFIPQTVVIEGEGGISAMKRSKYLVKGNFIKVFIMLILVFIAIALITEIISFGVEKSFFFLGQYSSALAEGASNVILVILEPFRIAVVTLLYYDFRIRKEGFDLEIMAEELEAGI